MPRVRLFLTALLASGMVAAGLAQSVVRTADPHPWSSALRVTMTMSGPGVTVRRPATARNGSQ